MAKNSNFAKEKGEEAGKMLEWSIEDTASGLRKRGVEFQEYLKKVHAEVEEWKFGVEESKDGFRVEWRVVAAIRRPKKKTKD